MAKFGKRFRQQKVKGWEQEYADYKALKHFIKINKEKSNFTTFYFKKIYRKFKFYGTYKKFQ